MNQTNRMRNNLNSCYKLDAIFFLVWFKSRTSRVWFGILSHHFLLKSMMKLFQTTKSIYGPSFWIDTRWIHSRFAEIALMNYLLLKTGSLCRIYLPFDLINFHNRFENWLQHVSAKQRTKKKKKEMAHNQIIEQQKTHYFELLNEEQ